MSNQDMINAILNSIQTDANLIILIRFLVGRNIYNVVPADGSTSPQLQVACQILGIPTT